MSNTDDNQIKYISAILRVHTVCMQTTVSADHNSTCTWWQGTIITCNIPVLYPCSSSTTVTNLLNRNCLHHQPHAHTHSYTPTQTYTQRHKPPEAHHPWSEPRFVRDLLEALLGDRSVLVDSLRSPSFLLLRYRTVVITTIHVLLISTVLVLLRSIILLRTTYITTVGPKN